MTTSPTAAPKVLSALVAAAIAITGVGLAQGEVGPVDSSHLVEIRHLRFGPAKLTVSPGDTIVWVNRDAVPHTVAALDSSWTSGHLAAGDSWRLVVEDPQAIGYLCEYHPTMRGSIEVQEVRAGRSTRYIP